MQFADLELVEEARREAGVRIGIYDKWVMEGRLTRELAEKRIAMMLAIAERLEFVAPLSASRSRQGAFGRPRPSLKLVMPRATVRGGDSGTSGTLRQKA
jgi:hypothetical protein